eukprot:3692105-Alexandrium_andersonii.AAC.1
MPPGKMFRLVCSPRSKCSFAPLNHQDQVWIGGTPTQSKASSSLGLCTLDSLGAYPVSGRVSTPDALVGLP